MPLLAEEKTYQLERKPTPHALQDEEATQASHVIIELGAKQVRIGANISDFDVSSHVSECRPVGMRARCVLSQLCTATSL